MFTTISKASDARRPAGHAGPVGCASLPDWLKRPLPAPRSTAQVRHVLRGARLNTVCNSAHCPNRPECFANGTATFMILGNVCTRACSFCAVPSGEPTRPAPDDPKAVADAAVALDLRHVVVTSVTRDDLPDGGAGHFALTIRALRQRLPQATVEVLTPDFLGEHDPIDRVLDAGPDVFNHNLETVRRLSPIVRPQADYDRSLAVFARAAKRARQTSATLLVKSGLMVGLGECDEEVRAAMADLRRAGCDAVTIGQYLPPSRGHRPVQRFVAPEQFARFRADALAMGFAAVAAGPFVRSSYRAEAMAAQAVANS